MFHSIPSTVLDRMHALEAIDAQDRHDGTPHFKRLRQIPPETGQFLALLAASAPAGMWVEVGTSAGYSTLWLALAARAVGARITTFDLNPEKIVLARETFKLAGVEDVITLVEGDARQYLSTQQQIAFAFLDAEKDVYADCYAAIVPNLVSGGLLIADNAISHQEPLQPFLDHVFADPRVDALIVPIGTGDLVCRKI